MEAATATTMEPAATTTMSTRKGRPGRPAEHDQYHAEKNNSQNARTIHLDTSQ
jgi:hypothetical protein